MSASRVTLPPFQYSRGGLMTRPLRDTFAEDKEGGGQKSAAEKENKCTETEKFNTLVALWIQI